MASVHVEQSAGRVTLSPGLKVTRGRRWVSIDDLDPVAAVSLAKQLSTGRHAVALCEEKSFARAFRDGRMVASLAAGKRTKISQWVKAGADAVVLEDLDGADADEAVEIIGDALGIPDRPIAKRAKTDELEAVRLEWESLVKEAKAIGAVLPTWAQQRRLNAIFGADAASMIRDQMALIRQGMTLGPPKRR
ncbi:MAG: hypothetical protein GQE15_27730 [Archangiaceae bacterium]|nr:hypothetical protein [Archangiaceae bacterium]